MLQEEQGKFSIPVQVNVSSSNMEIENTNSLPYQFDDKIDNKTSKFNKDISSGNKPKVRTVDILV